MEKQMTPSEAQEIFKRLESSLARVQRIWDENYPKSAEFNKMLETLSKLGLFSEYHRLVIFQAGPFDVSFHPQSFLGLGINLSYRFTVGRYGLFG